MEDLLQVGAITTTHGVRGEVKVFPMTDDVGRFKKLKKVLLENEGGYLELEITQALTTLMRWKNIRAEAFL